MSELPTPPEFRVRLDQDQLQTARRWGEQLTTWVAQVHEILADDHRRANPPAVQS